MDKTYVLDFASRLLGTDSPTGYTKKAIDLVPTRQQPWVIRLSASIRETF